MQPKLELLGMRDAAARLGIHPFSLRRMCEAGKVSPMRDSAGRRLFHAETIDNLARERAARQKEASK